MTTAFSLQQLAEKIGAEVVGDDSMIITAVATLASAKPGQIAFLANEKYRSQVDSTAASAIIVAPNVTVPGHLAALRVGNPYAGFARIAQLLDNTPNPAQGIDASARIGANVILGDNVHIGPNTVIADNVVLANDVMIGAGCYVGEGVRIGEGSKLWQHVVVYHACVIGNHCFIHSGSVIGADGLGWANEAGKWIKIPQLGRVVIGDGLADEAGEALAVKKLIAGAVHFDHRLIAQAVLVLRINLAARIIVDACAGGAGSDSDIAIL